MSHYRGMVFLALICGFIPPAAAQAPDSAFAQPPRQQPQFQVPPAMPGASSKKPVTMPNWNTGGSKAGPALAPPFAASAPNAASTMKTGVPAKNARAMPLAKERLTKFAPRRAALLQAQTKIRDEQNRIAQGLRAHAAGQQVMDKPPGSPLAQAPGRTSSLGAAAASHSPTSIRNASPSFALAHQPDGIWFVNGEKRDFVITPGGNVVISGKGFGPAPGHVFASGLTGFPGGAAALQVTAWNDFEIDAVLLAGIRGVPDLDGISAQAFTSAGKSFALGNGKFVAAREEIVLTSQLDRLVLLQPSSQWPGVMAADGGVHRRLGGDSLTCPSPGTDDLLFPQPPRGFQVSGVGMWHGRTDTGDRDAWGDAGNHMFIPGYSIGDWDMTSIAGGQNVDRLRIAWGVFRSHTSPQFLEGVANGDQCTSDYQVEVDLVGPAGVSPF